MVLKTFLELCCQWRSVFPQVGIGQAQVRSTQSAPRQPDFAVAAYSMLFLQNYSCLDLVVPMNIFRFPNGEKKHDVLRALIW